MPSAPSKKRVAKASAGVIVSSSRFERLLIESGAFRVDRLSPQEMLQLQHTIEQYAAIIAASRSMHVRGTAEV
jgi:hypothetical protein